MKLKEIIILTASYYGVTIKPEVLEMYADDLKGYDEQKVVEAYKTYRRDRKNQRMPFPAQIIDILDPVVDDESLARESVEILKHAIKEIGWPEPQKAREFVGEPIWLWITRNGGWLRVCQSDILTNEVAQAQMRESIKSHYKYGNKITEAIAMRALPYNPQISYDQHNDPGEQKLIELDQERSKQMKEFMEKFNLNSEQLKQGTK